MRENNRVEPRSPGRRSVISLPHYSQQHRVGAGRFPVPGADEIVVCPLGGVGRIGMNWTLYGHDGSWLLVDAGVNFIADVPGVEMIMPDPVMLASIAPKIVGLIVTHAHEDHIGAIAPLWGRFRVRIPIHATPFAAAIIKDRLTEAGQTPSIVRTFRPGALLSMKKFRVATIPVAHSVPEAVALAINTPAGTVVHTGDWKIDDAPVIGHRTSLKAFTKLGERGILALVGDSTNAARDGTIPSETEIADNMTRMMTRQQGLVVVSCFASNVDRIAGVIRAARSANRLVALAGRSMIKNEKAARATGLLPDHLETLADCRHLVGLDRSQSVLICTGTQGEPNSAMDRMAFDGAKHLPTIAPGDTIVHSSRIIPGRELEVKAMIASFAAKGANVLEAKDLDGSPLHASGHATRAHIRHLNELLRPRFLIPVHGDPDHLAAHAEIGRETGAEDAPILSEGECVSVSRHGIKRLGRLQPRLLGGARSTTSNRMNLFAVNEADLVPLVDRTQRTDYEQSGRVAV